ncbi:phage tail length tape measure family protein [Methylobacterium sp. 10]|uniref:phage tail length tape measure family protein n=1 Tax=Methylobacterium sp. 10 TaxID=1101191 RepID=UPI0004BA3C10|nr:phage tail length tape measure family protein [Methylobacterium sp. 10]
MADLAILGLEIDSRPAADASTVLDRLAGSATKADTASAAFTQATMKTGAALATVSRAASDTASAIDRVRDASGRFTSTSSVIDKMAKDWDRATKSATAYEQALARGAAANPQNTPSALPALPSANDNPAARRGLDSNQKRDLMYQGGDVVASLGSGAGLGTVAFQQGPQILQGLAGGEGGLKGGLAALGQSAMALVTPVTVATTAVAGLGIAFGVAAAQARSDQTALQNATQGLGRASGNTAEQLDTVARANAEAGRVSTSTAREMVAAYNSTGEIGTSVFGTLIQVTERYAQLTGQDAASATQELTRTFADIGSGADAVASRIGGLDDRTRQLIQTQIEQGDRSAAQQTLADSLKASIDANAASTTGWASAWNTATAAANGYWEAAKRIAGIKLGVAPEGAQEAVTRLQTIVDNTNKTRTAMGMEPLNPRDSKDANQLEVARVIADQERMIAEGRAAEARADKASSAAGAVARQIDPNFSRLSQLREQQTALRDGLADPLARNRLADQAQTEEAYTATTRAITTMTDATGKMISAEEISRRSDQLKIDSTNAKTEAEKRNVAERQKAFDLIGKTITPGDARGQIARAGAMSTLESASKGGGKSGGGSADALDDYDRATKRIEDQTRRMEEQNTTFGMGAGVVAKYRAEQELLTAAKRADRDITPQLTAQITDYATKSAAAATALEQTRQSAQQSFALQGFAGNEIVNALDGMATRGATVSSIFSNMTASLTRAALQASVMGTGPLAGLFGTAAAPGTNAAGGLIGSLFSSMPKFALGGITDGPSIAGEVPGQREAVVPLPSGGRIPVQFQGGASAQPMNLQVTVNNAPSQPTVTQAPDGRGGKRLEITFDEMAAAAVSRDGSRTKQALNQRTLATR